MITLLSSFSKILEKIVSQQLVSHLEYHKLLSPRQFGFQRKKNTEHYLLNVVNFISKALNEGNFCIGIFLDLKNAFISSTSKDQMEEVEEWVSMSATI